MNNVYNCCKICGKELSGRQLYFCSPACKNKHFQDYEIQVQRGHRKRNALVQKLNAKCSICGYNTSPSTLLFMRDYQQIPLSIREIANHDAKYLNQKLAGATLVCKNCASEIENNDINQKFSNLILDFQQFLTNLDSLKLKATDKIVLAVSGGVDSIVMLDLFSKAGYKNMIIAHLNHGVRADAEHDQALVKKLAEKYNFPFKTKTITRPTTGNLENELRKIRRKFLEGVADEHKAKYVALAHNANDQAETLILNLVRGAGLAGLSGMNISEGKIIRPLLNFTREEIEGYATKHNLKWHEDITNRDIKYRRNFVRHKVLPLLKQLNPEYLSAIRRTSSLLKKVDDHFDIELRSVSLENQREINYLQELDDPLLYKLISLNFEQAAGSKENFELKHFEMIKELIQSKSGTKEIDLPGNIVARRSYGILEFLKKKEDNIASNQAKSLDLGENKFGGWRLLVEITKKTEFSRNKNVLFIEASNLTNLKVKGWENGDFIEKEGISGTKKLQDLFTDAKISKVKRKNWPVIIRKNEIIWVPMLAFSRKINIDTGDIIKITARKETREKE